MSTLIGPWNHEIEEEEGRGTMGQASNAEPTRKNNAPDDHDRVYAPALVTI